MDINANDVIARYQQELANVNQRAIIAEAGLAAAEKRIAELEAEIAKDAPASEEAA